MVLLWLGWFGFNGGSTLAMNEDVPGVIANTVFAGGAGLVAAMGLGWLRRGRADVGSILNGSLAGLVAITAGALAVSTPSAVIIGVVGGVVMVGAEVLLERCRIDDAVGAVPVHLAAGIWGTIAVALFGDLDRLGTNLGLMEQLQAQVEGVLVCGAWAFGVTTIVLRLVDRLSPLRVTPEQETDGLNISEHGATTELIDLFRVMEHQSRTGELDLRVPVEPFTEVGQIANRYNAVMEALERATARTEATVRSAMDGVITFAKDTFSVLSLNPAAELIFGYSQDRLVSQPVTMLFDGHGTGSSTIPDIILHEGHRETVGRREDGTTFPMEVSLTHAETGENDFYVGTFRDITERKRFEEALKEARVSAEEANNAKSVFLASMSHEIRTPLNAILGYAQILEGDPDVSDSQRRAIVTIENSGNHLLTLINDILDISKIEAGREVLRLADFDLGAILQSTESMFAVRCAQKDLTWCFESQIETLAVHGDEGKLRQVLINLLGNAVKFTVEGGVLLRVTSLEEGQVTFDISDTGPGIAQDRQVSIFEPFQQDSEGLREGGSGLGLAIASRQVELMGGRIQLESQPGEGARFFFTIPFEPARDPVAVDETSSWTRVERLAPGSTVHALVVDDVETNRELLARFLRQVGVDVEVAENGVKALERVTDRMPDIIFMDMLMPELDGPSTLERLQETYGSDVPTVVAVTASVLEHQREHYMVSDRDAE